ncbi:MAG: hypothetical protein HN742_01375 [Lentisphaerae bacterium]|jgi:hypothetical protein|nr:hypothetical protein [Lentisphaerota bacterium]MBT4817877.1 hypothetical protein [Lentisphaerota bacterium]MBT5612549.1 hypothetical protein [Lentisphaerota bacterium]MBT7061344.1 hypothetical protein [Lentisphaerota bacterium]MBT7840485.1 hypothetical protein [Lentisphaerota bacterium]
MEFHHIGIPTDKKRENETYMEGAKLYVTDVADSEHKIEWLRFEDGSPMPEALQKVPHVAFKVDNVAEAMEGKPCLLEPFEAAPGVTVGFILEDDAPVEYMSIDE